MLMIHRLTLILLAVLVLPTVVLAHALGVEVTLRDSTISVVVYYDDDTPAEQAKVKVSNSASDLIAQGETDERGMWSFPRPEPGTYTLAIEDGAGHAKKLQFTIPSNPTTEQSATTEPTREQFTGSNRWLYSLVGVLLIGGATFALRAVLRRK